MNRLIINLYIIISIFLAFMGDGLASDKLPVFVTIAPQKYFVQQIGKDLVDIHIMVPPGANPHIYELKPKQMVAISKAKLYFTIGVEFEKANLKKIVSTNQNLKVVHTDHGIDKISMHADHHDGVEHGHEKGGHHDEVEHGHEKGDHHDEDVKERHKKHETHHEHHGLDPHIWLSPSLVKSQARIILKALQDNDPDHRNAYESNFQQFAAQIDELDADLNKLFGDKKGLQFIVFHPSWGYFAHAYGLEQVSIEIEGKDPKPAQLKALIEHAKKEKIKMVFVQPQFSIKTAELIAKEIGGQVAFADPLAKDWMVNLRHVADKFKSALK